MCSSDLMGRSADEVKQDVIARFKELYKVCEPELCRIERQTIGGANPQ